MLTEMYHNLQEAARSVGLLDSPQPSTPQPPLAAALAALDITPFEALAVDTYKRESLQRAMDTKTSELRSNPYYRKLTSPVTAANYPVESVLGMAWTGAALHYYHPDITQMRYPRLFALKWFRESVGVLSADVPEFVRHKMTQITSAVPGVDFQTDTLRSNEKHYDPFLVARLGQEEYYIEVWGDDDHAFPRH